MGYFFDNWGSFAGLLGVVISTAGLAAAWVAMQRAGKARDSAEAAELASRETRDAITAVLVVVELQRAIALIQRIKVLLSDEHWRTSLEHYQPLRAMLSDVKVRFPFPHSEDVETIQTAIGQLTAMEDTVRGELGGGTDLSVQSSISPNPPMDTDGHRWTA